MATSRSTNMQGRFTRTIIWRPIVSAPRDGSLIEVTQLDETSKPHRTPERTQWYGGPWSTGWEPTNWRPIDKSLYPTVKGKR